MTDDFRLRDSLVSALGGLSFAAIEDLTRELEPGTIIVTTAAECSARQCARLAELGFRLVVLVPIPQEREWREYRAASVAAYVSMTLDLKLAEVISSLRSEQAIGPARIS